MGRRSSHSTTVSHTVLSNRLWEAFSEAEICPPAAEVWYSTPNPINRRVAALGRDDYDSAAFGVPTRDNTTTRMYFEANSRPKTTGQFVAGNGHVPPCSEFVGKVANG